jgi:hypothetical protein
MGPTLNCQGAVGYLKVVIFWTDRHRPNYSLLFKTATFSLDAASQPEHTALLWPAAESFMHSRTVGNATTDSLSSVYFAFIHHVFHVTRCGFRLNAFVSVRTCAPKPGNAYSSVTREIHWHVHSWHLWLEMKPASGYWSTDINTRRQYVCACARVRPYAYSMFRITVFRPSGCWSVSITAASAYVLLYHSLCLYEHFNTRIWP